MNTRIATTLLAAASLAAFAEEPAAPAAELEEEGNLPGVTLGADYTYEYDQGGNEDDDHC